MRRIEGPIGIAFFVSDLHGLAQRYERLFAAIAAERPAAVFLGGDLLPHHLMRHARTAPEASEADGASDRGETGDFLDDYLLRGLEHLRASLGISYPRIFLILGNDDARATEGSFLGAQSRGLCEYSHGRRIAWGSFLVYGYSCIPPSPFRLKDWERYDVSQFVDVGCIPPEEGYRTVDTPEGEARNATIQEELGRLFDGDDLSRAVFLCHVPPYRSNLDRAALDGMKVDHAPIDVNIGSIAVRRFIEERQPLLTLHGHVHESARLTGSWRDRIGRTLCLSAAHDGPELALVRFDPEDPEAASRALI